jgi:putative metalloprotease
MVPYMTKILMILFCLSLIFGCDNTDLQTATDAGLDAVKAITLSDKDVFAIAAKSSDMSDKKNQLAPADNAYSIRLSRIVTQNFQDGEIAFNYRIYLSPEVNAFAMADGTIRIYSGLMEMMNDGELRFVIGHEMGHVLKKHIRKKIQLAYAASAVRKGIASQENAAGDIARSLVGSLAQSLMNAHFSQLEEKEADDYGLLFLKKKGFEPGSSVSALKKLANLNKGHTFLSSHPDPDKRAERLQAQLEGRALSIEENKQNILGRLKVLITGIIALVKDKLSL